MTSAARALQRIVILDLMNRREINRPLVEEFSTTFPAFTPDTTPIFSVITDWTYQCRWSDRKNPINIPHGDLSEITNEHGSIVRRLKAYKPETVLLVAPNFFADQSDADFKENGLGMDFFKSIESPKNFAGDDLTEFLKSDSKARIVIYDPCLREREENPIIKDNLEALVQERTAAFAKKLGISADRITIATTPKAVMTQVSAPQAQAAQAR